MTSKSAETIGSLKEQAAQLLHEVVEQATNKALTETKSTRNRTSRLVRSATRQSTPSARDIALNAASGAIELWQAARDRAEGTLETVQSTVVDSASELKSSAHGIKGEAVDAARTVTSAVGESARSVTSAVGDSAHKAADTSKSAAVASARAGRNTLSLVFWAGAAGTIAYFAFLDEERRNQVKTFAMRAIDEGRSVLTDLRGQDGEFN